MIDDPSLVNEFLEEAVEHVQRIEAGLLVLERSDGPGTELVNDVFRAMHSIKGAAGMLGFDRLREVTHIAETVLDRLRKQTLESSPAVVSALLRATDAVRTILEDLSTEASFGVSGPVTALEAVLVEGPNAADTAEETSPKTGESVESATEPGHEASLADDLSAASSPGDGGPQETPVEPPAPQAEPPKPQANTPAATSTTARAANAAPTETVRVPVWVLDRLMALAGELVLVRNRSLLRLQERLLRDRTLANGIDRRLSQQLDLVTSELQEAVLRARMQPIDRVFTKLPRLCRDLGSSLGKEIQVNCLGGDVEVDKTILERLSDPLLHLVRNSCDHGLEKTEERLAAGKSQQGTVRVEARHEGGQIAIEVADDGKGIDIARVGAKAIENGICRPDELAAMTDNQIFSLVFAPGFSTAAVVSDVSGRGVGMDVVKTSIEGIGGTVSVDSAPGVGTTFCMRVPLTLAIVSSLIIRVRGRVFAIPQVNLEEIVRLHDGEVSEQIEYVNSQPVYRLRRSLLPLVYLDDVLEYPDGVPASALSNPPVARMGADGNLPTSMTFAVVRAGSLRFGIIVDEAVGSEEIVVKPSHPILKSLRCFVGCTILGDGSVALILDANGVARHAALDYRLADSTTRENSLPSTLEPQQDLLFTTNGHDQYLVSVGLVSRIVPIDPSRLERFGDEVTVEVDGRSVRVVRLHRHLPGDAYPDDGRELLLILPRHIKRPIGFLASGILGVHETIESPDTEVSEHEAVLGSTLIEGRVALHLDLFALARLEEPSWFQDETDCPPSEGKRILLVDDAPFFRTAVSRYLKDLGADVEVAEDGQEALEMLTTYPDRYDLLVSDLEMPNLDGFGLIKAVRASPETRLQNLPALSLSSLHSPEDRARAVACGFDRHEVKLDKDRLGTVLRDLLQNTRASNASRSAA